MLAYRLLAAAAVLATALAAPTDQPCTCQGTWLDDSGDCSDSPVQQHGCPTLAELRRCSPDTRIRQCQTTSPNCAGQFNQQVNFFEYCDITDPHQRSVLKAIAEGSDASKCMTKVNRANTTQVFDLSPLHKRAGQSVNTANWKSSKYDKYNHEDRDYLINICGPLANAVDIGPNYTDVGAYEKNTMGVGDPGDESWYPRAMGRFAQSSLQSVHEGDLRLIMPNGTGSTHEAEKCPQRQTLIIFFCDEPTEGNPLGQPYFVDEFNTCEYVFVWNSCAACPLGHQWRETNCGEGANWEVESSGYFGGSMAVTSPATALMITVLVCFSVYCVIGTAYNRLIMGQRGAEQIPNYSFWEATCASACAAPGYLISLVRGKPKLSGVSQNMGGGLLDDSDEDDVDEDAENHEYE